MDASYLNKNMQNQNYSHHHYNNAMDDWKIVPLKKKKTNKTKKNGTDK